MGLLKLLVLTAFLTLAFSALASAQMGMFGGGMFPIMMMMMRSGIDIKQLMPFIWMMMMNGGGGGAGPTPTMGPM
ncbi:hypothetical protein ACOMHN_028784 [Nucella lapillus]